MLDLDVKVVPTNFTIRFVAESIDGRDDRWDRLRSTKQLTDVKLEPISGNGYLSSINRVSFFFESEEKPFSVVLKVPITTGFKEPINEDRKKDADSSDTQKNHSDEFGLMVSRLHDKEVYFYEHVAPKDHQLSLPKIYASGKCASSEDLSSAYLLMEDLSGTGGLANVSQGLTNEQIESVIVAIADFHAFSLALPQDVVSHFTAEPPKKNNDDFENMVVDKLLATGSDYIRKHATVMRKFLAATESWMSFQGYSKFGTRPVLSHCDLWVNNIFFKKTHDGSITDAVCAFLDWQCAHLDTGIGDLSHLILVGASPDMKERHLDDWLQLYCGSFADATRRYGVENHYDVELVRKMWAHHYPSEIFFSFIVFAFSYEKATCDEERTSLLDRFESCFEVVRKDYE